jgi:hydrogenase expression/formation protein HypC
MCIGIPMRVMQTGEGYAWCEGRGERQRLDTLLVGPQPQGAWVLAFQGSALRIMSAEDAAQTNAALDALEAALLGEQEFGGFFADLVGREPQLPEHLRKATGK